MVRPYPWRGAKAVGKEALLAGGKILTDIADKISPDVSTGDIVSIHMTESSTNLIIKLRRSGRKRTKRASRYKAKTKRHKLT
jgi:ribosomal 50S subunit-recycling heat shock protein